MIACDMQQCKYFSQGICMKRLTIIDVNAMCSEWWISGQQKRRVDDAGTLYKNEISITEVDFKDYVKPQTPPEQYHQITFDEYLSTINT